MRLEAPDNCVLAIYGDVEAARILTAVEKALGPWNGTAASPRLSDIRKRSIDVLDPV